MHIEHSAAVWSSASPLTFPARCGGGDPGGRYSVTGSPRMVSASRPGNDAEAAAADEEASASGPGL
uniref:Uncharacterized protein n=1 Tax=Arundo donax TaxID=35708 RepID=A0A0A9GSC8_ARUDO